MARSHTCGQCGEELGWIAAQREDVYGFMVVRCPRCGAVWVRRFAELDRRLRRARRGLAALMTAVTTLGLLGFAGFAWVVMSLAYTGETVRMGFPLAEVAASLAEGGWGDADSLAGRWRAQSGHVVLIAAVCVAVATGAILMVVCPHVRRAWVWGVFAAGVLGVVGLGHVGHLVESADVRAAAALGSGPTPLSSPFRWVSRVFLVEMLRVQAVMGVAALVGVPLGRVAKMRLGRIRQYVVWRIRGFCRKSRTPD